jgi:hypothetical protein
LSLRDYNLNIVIKTVGALDLFPLLLYQRFEKRKNKIFNCYPQLKIFEKNLLAKKFIQKIMYSAENIKISLWKVPQNSDTL